MVALPLLTFLVFAGGIYAAYWAFVIRPEQEIAGVARKRLRAGQLGAKGAARRSGLRKQFEAMSAVGAIDAVLNRSHWRAKVLQSLVEQSGVRVTVGVVLASSALLALLAFVVVQRVLSALLFGTSGGALAAFGVAALAAGGAAVVPVGLLRFKRTLRMRKFEEQFPEALDLLSRALKAGHAFTTGIDMVGSEMQAPVGPEFRTLYEQQNFGMPMPDALRALADRIPVLDARFFVTAVLIQRDSGGNLSEVLENLSGVMRERFRVKRQMRVLSAHGRITGWVLVGMPPALGTAIMIVNPESRRTMFGDPLGIQMLVGAAVLQIIGMLIIRKIVDVEY